MSKHIQIDGRYKEKSTYLYNFTPNVDCTTVQGDYILFFGRISEEKGLRTLLNVMKQLPDVKLKIAGTGPLLEILSSDAPANVEFLGFKKGLELQELIQNASFVVVPSEWYENNPLAIIESFMAGTPVIGSDIGGIPELVADGKTGYIFHPKSCEELKDAIMRAWSLPEGKYKQMSDEAKRFAIDNFSEDNHYNRLMENYQLVINKNR